MWHMLHYIVSRHKYNAVINCYQRDNLFFPTKSGSASPPSPCVLIPLLVLDENLWWLMTKGFIQTGCLSCQQIKSVKVLNETQSTDPNQCCGPVFFIHNCSPDGRGFLVQFHNCFYIWWKLKRNPRAISEEAVLLICYHTIPPPKKICHFQCRSGPNLIHYSLNSPKPIPQWHLDWVWCYFCTIHAHYQWTDLQTDWQNKHRTQPYQQAAYAIHVSYRAMRPNNK